MAETPDAVRLTALQLAVQLGPTDIIKNAQDILVFLRGENDKPPVLVEGSPGPKGDKGDPGPKGDPGRDAVSVQPPPMVPDANEDPAVPFSGADHADVT